MADYKIEENSSAGGLSSAVAAKLRGGWELVGAPFTDTKPDGKVVFYQAIQKK